MPKRFLNGVKQPKPYLLGVIGPNDMDPDHLKFVVEKINHLTWWAPNLEILVHGFKEKAEFGSFVGVEVVAGLYAKRYWYTLRVYRDIKYKKGFDHQFFEDAMGFVVFDDNSDMVDTHCLIAGQFDKKVKIFQLPE